MSDTVVIRLAKSADVPAILGYKQGQCGDAGWWEMSIQPKIQRPKPPLPLSQAQMPGWAEALAEGISKLR